jgi:hypothetical protein
MYYLTMRSFTSSDWLGFSGTLVACLRMARRMHRRMGYIGSITRPDGSNMRDRVVMPLPRGM